MAEEEQQALLGTASTSWGARGQRGQRLYGSGILKEEDCSSVDSVEDRHRGIMTVKQFANKCCNKEAAKEKLPITRWLPKYRLYDLQCDLISGLTVALTVLPQGLAYAIIANLPQQYGLYSAFMGCFVYTLLGTSKDITLGPTAIMSLLTAAFATSPVENDPTYAIILCLECGVVQLLMGVLHLGIIVNFISYPVINAFTSAAAITIACGQIKGILGLKNIPREFLEMIYETAKHIPQTRVWDLTMGLSCLVILIGIKYLKEIKLKPSLPNGEYSRAQRIFQKSIWILNIAKNALIVVTASGIVAIMHSYGYKTEISITGDVPAGLPPFQIPNFSVKNGNETISFGEILGDISTGLGIVPLLGLVESIAIGKAFARQNDYKISPNQELIAIGVANIASSLVSAYPVTGSFSRTAVNSQSGVRTPMGGLFTGGVILLSLQFLTPLFKFIPKSALSAVIISAVIQMVDYEILIKFWKVQKLALVPWTFTFVLSFILGIEYGILIGIGVQVLMLLYPVARPRMAFRHQEYLVVTFNQAIKFPSVEYVQQKVLQEMAKDEEKPQSVILDCTHLTGGLDYTTIQGFLTLDADFRKRNVNFAMACVAPHIMKEMHQVGMKDIIVGKDIDETVRKLKDAEDKGMIHDTVIDTATVTNGHIAYGSNGHFHTFEESYPTTPIEPHVNQGYEGDGPYCQRL